MTTLYYKISREARAPYQFSKFLMSETYVPIAITKEDWEDKHDLFLIVFVVVRPYTADNTLADHVIVYYNFSDQRHYLSRTGYSYEEWLELVMKHYL